MSFNCKNLSCPTLTKNCWILILAILQIAGVGLNAVSIFGYPDSSTRYWFLYAFTRFAGVAFFAASCALTICLPFCRFCYYILMPIEMLIQMLSLVMYFTLNNYNIYGRLTAAVACRVVLIVVEIYLIRAKKLDD